MFQNIDSLVRKIPEITPARVKNSLKVRTKNKLAHVGLVRSVSSFQ